MAIDKDLKAITTGSDCLSIQWPAGKDLLANTVAYGRALNEYDPQMWNL